MKITQFERHENQMFNKYFRRLKLHIHKTIWKNKRSEFRWKTTKLREG